MPNVTQQNPYHDKLAQILSQQVSADFDNFSMEETSEEVILHVHIPKSFFVKQIKPQKNTQEKQLSERAKKILEFSGCWADDEATKQFSTQAIAERRQANSRDRYL